jgi:hypothetical protein
VERDHVRGVVGEQPVKLLRGGSRRIRRHPSLNRL